ncbi:MAG: SDR family oxidoreductase [Candidatus Latescibacteria bacterium]|jgi:NAD(P)-dependent dehydrogenase (short-subunit alcohol dehydrogenase family)|nr:SDR family oxidoreductase [Candidatus Latescibacterota bacterium]
MGKLDGKVALVTGASRGIGKGIARGLAQEGAALVMASRDPETLEAAAEEIRGEGVDVLAHAADVSDDGQVGELFRQAMAQFRRLDILVNNAGAFDGGPIDQLSIEAWDKVIAVNLRGPFLCTRAAVRIMKAQGGGRIINIGSISAQRVRPNSAPYSTSKFGIWGLTQVTALEGRDHGIACSCLHPGNTLVERRQDSGVESDDEPMMSVEELAQAAVLMATLPPHVNMLESIVLPVGQLYVGRG